MLPLNDSEHNHYGSLPLMTITLIWITSMIHIGLTFFAWRESIYDEISIWRDIYYLFGSIPKWIVEQKGAGALTSISTVFLHGGLFHLVSNMWVLWIFGRRVEDACGPWRFLCYYLVCGITADILTVAFLPNMEIPGIGASGAIYGVMGAYLLLYPGGRIRMFLLVGWVPLVPRVRAIWLIPFYFVSEMLSAYWMAQGQQTGIGHLAHVGGFLGAVFLPLFLRPEAFQRYINDVPV
jgi:membrane associated rhomboid family serine protease